MYAHIPYSSTQYCSTVLALRTTVQYLLYPVHCTQYLNLISGNLSHKLDKANKSRWTPFGQRYREKSGGQRQTSFLWTLREDPDRSVRAKRRKLVLGIRNRIS